MTSKLGSVSVLMDEQDILLALEKISGEIIAKGKNLDNLALVGIKTRGEHIARRLESIIEKLCGRKSNFGTLDITLYRDDFDSLGDLTVGETDLMFDVSGKRIILVDDVLYSGRTIRAALDQIIDFGRPAEIELAVLVDRGGRQSRGHGAWHALRNGSRSPTSGGVGWQRRELGT